MSPTSTPAATSQATDRLPFFVYGTLRAGQGNYAWALQGRTVTEQRATLTAHLLLDGGGFPYAIPAPDGEGTIIGEVMTVSDEDYLDVQRDLDRLEGYVPGRRDNHYDRITVTVTLEDGTQVQAYTYVASERYATRIKHLPVIDSGCWTTHDAARVRSYYR